MNRLEAKVATLFRAKGYYTVVSAGSRGPADVVALKPNEVVLVQVKAGRVSQLDREALLETARRLDAKAVLVERKGRRLTTYSLNGNLS